MKKLILLALMAVCLALVAAPVEANLVPTCPDNEIKNPEFKTDFNSATDWIPLPPTSSGGWYRQAYNEKAETYTGDNRDEYLYQVFNEAGYWNPNLNAKLWSASAWGKVNDSTRSDLDVDLYITFYAKCGTTPTTDKPAFDPANPVGWTQLVQFHWNKGEQGTQSLENQLLACQPFWMAVSIYTDGNNTCSEGLYSYADNICFEGKCVPLPGAVLLLGAGLVRLVAYARRRQEN